MPSFSNPDPQQSDLMEGAITAEMSSQPLWSESNLLATKYTSTFSELFPGLSYWELPSPLW